MPEALRSPYRDRPGPLHRLPATAKLLGAVAFVLAVVLLPRGAWAGYGAAGALLFVLGAASRVPPGHFMKRLLLLEPLALGVALLSLLQPDGLRIFLSMLTRSTLCLACMILLATTTRFSDLLRALVRLRVSSLLVTTLLLMDRYLVLLVEEAGRMQRARRARTFSGDRWSRWRASASVLAHLFVRTSERAERVYAAMCARGWRT